MFPSPQTSWVGPLLEISRVLAGPAASHTDSQFPRVPIGRRTGRTDLGEMLCNCLLMWTRGLSGEALPSAAASVTSFHAPSFRVVRSPRTLISGRSLSQGPGLSCIEASVGSGSGNRSTRLTAFDQILSTLREKRHKLGLTKSVLLRMDARGNETGGSGGQVGEKLPSGLFATNRTLLLTENLSVTVNALSPLK